MMPYFVCLGGYGFIHVPTVPGMHELECVTWKPVGTFKDQITSRLFYTCIMINNLWRYCMQAFLTMYKKSGCKEILLT